MDVFHDKEAAPLEQREFPPMTADQARLLNPLQLAYIGDSVWDLLIRSRLIYRGRNVHNMHRDATSRVNAGAQAAALTRIASLLTPEEEDIARRGRNAHARHPAPKNQNPADYQSATGLEALIGFLYLTGQEARALELFRRSQEEDHA